MRGHRPQYFPESAPQSSYSLDRARRGCCAPANHLAVLLCCLALGCSAGAQVRLQDIFGRSLNQRGITLVDGDGYMANPLIKFYLLPPTDAALPGSVTLSAKGARLYFNNPCQISANGPSASRSLTDPNKPVAVALSLFPAHTRQERAYSLSLVFTDAHNTKQTNTLPIRVIDEDTRRSNDFVVTANFDRDVTGLFANPVARLLVQQAADDWTYYFASMNLDPVLVGSEKTRIWSNNFDGGYNFTNTNTYTGYQLYAYGTVNTAVRSGGEASHEGNRQTSGGNPLPLHRSGGFEANIQGNWNTLGWLFLTNDDDWHATRNLGHETNDFYSIAHHEIGHALIFNIGHPGYAKAFAKGAFTSDAVKNYYGRPVPIDAGNDHLTGVIDPESGQGALGYEYHGDIPRCRWTMTKLDLLCAQEIGYTLRSNAAFALFTFPASRLPEARMLFPYTNTLTVTGGIPIYNWKISAGALPPGLGLEPFTGVLSGTPAASGVFHFTVCVTDYHENSAGLTQDFSLSVSSPGRLATSPSLSQ
jgi:Putative Ig domain